MPEALENSVDVFRALWRLSPEPTEFTFGTRRKSGTGTTAQVLSKQLILKVDTES